MPATAIALTGVSLLCAIAAAGRSRRSWTSVVVALMMTVATLDMAATQFQLLHHVALAGVFLAGSLGVLLLSDERGETAHHSAGFVVMATMSMAMAAAETNVAETSELTLEHAHSAPPAVLWMFWTAVVAAAVVLAAALNASMPSLVRARARHRLSRSTLVSGQQVCMATGMLVMAIGMLVEF